MTDKLPTLPEPLGSCPIVVGHEQVRGMTADIIEEIDGYSAAQMHTYALAAVMAERARCAKVCEDSLTYNPDDPGGFFANLICQPAAPMERDNDQGEATAPRTRSNDDQ